VKRFVIPIFAGSEGCLKSRGQKRAPLLRGVVKEIEARVFPSRSVRRSARSPGGTRAPRAFSTPHSKAVAGQNRSIFHSSPLQKGQLRAAIFITPSVLQEPEWLL
jgi:hypothetical protein